DGDAVDGGARRDAVPRGPVEELVAATWCEVLGLERVDAHDSFFDLGGHSLLAAQAISRLRQAFGVELQLRDLFAAPTVAGLAERIEAVRRQQAARPGTAAPPAAPPLAALPRVGPPPLGFAQERLWFLDRLAPGTPLHHL